MNELCKECGEELSPDCWGMLRCHVCHPCPGCFDGGGPGYFDEEEEATDGDEEE